ncbi:Far-red impaired responsive family protein [Theobroma cacao]|uniref:Far-red impaired responsive family protein n=1 Tax=Theobroma cacao TaxID=3641 RepID=A0A061EKD1_THECC|nr:Far-red impaired responsive family protein [Theobroma cacao]
MVEFGVHGDVNGGMVLNSVQVEAGSMDNENEAVESPVEETFQQGVNEKMDRTSPERDDIPEGIPADEPYVGQEFESEAAAHAFYNAYATRVGFIIRVSKLSRSRRDGSAIGRALVCNKEGFRMPDKREKIVRQRAETRVGCRAMILVRKVSSGKWVVTKFMKEHTHPLTPGKGRRDCIYDQYPRVEVDYLRIASLYHPVRSWVHGFSLSKGKPVLMCHISWNLFIAIDTCCLEPIISRNILTGRVIMCNCGYLSPFSSCYCFNNEHNKIRELTQQLANEKKRAATYKRHLELIFEQIEEHNESLSKKIQHIVDSVREMDNKEQLSHV